MISALTPSEPRLCEYFFCAASLFAGVSMRSVVSTIRAHCEKKEICTSSKNILLSCYDSVTLRKLNVELQ